jgi:hypothetical protein
VLFCLENFAKDACPDGGGLLVGVWQELKERVWGLGFRVGLLVGVWQELKERVWGLGFRVGLLVGVWQELKERVSEANKRERKAKDDGKEYT